MATQHGFGSSVSSGLTFAYDTIDTVNSYLGEPTTNLINPNTVNIYSWWGRTVQTITQLSETYNGQPIYRVSLSIDDGDMLYHIRERWGAGSGWYMPYVIFNASTPYIASVIYRPVSHADTRVYGHPSNIGGWGRNVDDSIYLDGGWKKHRIHRKHNLTVGDNRFYHMHTPSAEIGQTVTVDITHSQIEQKDHVTQFTPTARSATQGLLPLAGISTLNLSNVSFDANAQMVFDGTDDTLDTGIPLTDLPALSNFTIECIVKIDAYPTAASPNGYGSTTKAGVLVGATYYSGTALYWYGNSSGTNCTVYAYIRGNDGYRTAGAYNLTPGQYHHLVLVNDYTNSSINLYANGVLNGTYAGPTQDYNPGLTPSAGNIGINKAQVDGGGTQVYSNLPCLVPITKIYNRSLSSAEVTQNFKKYQTRFGLA